MAFDRDLNNKEQIIDENLSRGVTSRPSTEAAVLKTNSALSYAHLDLLAKAPVAALLPRIEALNVPVQAPIFFQARLNQLLSGHSSELQYEVGMLRQVLTWLGRGGTTEIPTATFYATADLILIYEVGRLYYLLGYFAAAERIFLGLSQLDHGLTASRLGLGLCKLENSLYDDALHILREVCTSGHYQLPGKCALVALFVNAGELSRAKSLLLELAPELESQAVPGLLRKFWEIFSLRCEGR